MLPAVFVLLGACRSPWKAPAAAAAAPPPTRQPRLLDEDVVRSDRTVLEALWALEKAVRERDRRIAELEAELENARRDLARLRGRRGSRPREPGAGSGPQ